jgi:hypothetical protein
METIARGVFILIASASLLGTSPVFRSAGVTSERCETHWPVPADTVERAAAAQLSTSAFVASPLPNGATLRVVTGNESQGVPAGIGVDPSGARISPVYTDGCDGVIRVGSSEATPHLWQFFEEWGVRLSQHCVGEYCDPQGVRIVLDGKPVSMCPGAIALEPGTDIRLSVAP